MTIAQEVLAGLREAGQATGTGPLVLTFTREGAATNPWDTPGVSTTYTLTCVDMGIKQVYVEGSAATRKARMLMADATGTEPKIGDRVTIGGASHDVLGVMPLAPAGTALMYNIEVSS